MTVRVRSILSSLDDAAKKLFLQFLPIPILPTDECKVSVKYPTALLNALPKKECYSILGILTESLLHYNTLSITIDTLLLEIDKITLLTPEIKEKITKSKTTKPF